MMLENDIIRTPWPKELVAKLNELQHNSSVHPYTCDKCRDTLGTRFVKQTDDTLLRDKDFDTLRMGNTKNVVILDRELIATENGWICPTCDWKQNWCIDPAVCWTNSEWRL